MNLIRKDKTQVALQKAYDDAYSSSLQSIILETQNNPQAALQSWNATLSSITQNMSKFSTNHTPKSTTEQSLMSSILDIERQCHDRISFLESRRYANTNSPYMSNYNSSSTLNNSTSSYHKKSQSEEYGRPSLSVPRKNLPSKSDPLLIHTTEGQMNYYRSGGVSAPPVPPLPSSSSYLRPNPSSYPSYPSYPLLPPLPSHPPISPILPAVPTSIPPIQSYNSYPSYSPIYKIPPTPPPPPPPLPPPPHHAPPVPPVPPPHHHPSPSSSSTLVPINSNSTISSSSVSSITTTNPNTPTLRSKSAADLPQPAAKSMIKTLRTSGKSGRINFPKSGTSSASAAATLAWSSDRPAKKLENLSLRPSANGSSKSYSGGTTTTTTTVLRPSGRSATPPSKSLIDDAPLIDLTTEVIQPARSKSQPPHRRTPPPSIRIPTTAEIRSQYIKTQPKLTPQQAAMKRSMASNALSTTTKPNTTPKAASKPTPKPTPKLTPKPIARATPTPTTANKTTTTIHRPTTPKSTPKPTHRPTTPTTLTPKVPPKPGPKPTSIKIPLAPSPSPEPSTADTDSEWEQMAREKVKAIRGIDEHAAEQILNEIVLQGDEVHWEDIAGLEQAKTSLKETVVYPFLRPDLFSGLREPARGMLLFGPPGTGKTMLARAVATESKSTFFSISASSLTSKFLGESEKLVRALFQMAKALAPAIIFVDEIDSLLSTRSESGEHEASRRIKTEFLVQWSDLQHAAAGRDNGDDLERVLVLAATNFPWGIDEAARRRFVRRQYIPLPERETRCAHLQKLLSNQKHALTDDDFQKLIDLTDGFSGSDMTALAKDAAMGPLRSLGEALLTTPRDKIRPMGIEDFISSLNTIRPSVSKEGLKAFEDWAALYGSSGA